MERKSDIRKRILQERLCLPVEEKQSFDRVIFEKIINHPLYLQAKDVFCYMPIRGEVETRVIVEASWKLGKRVAVPKVLSKTKMEFYYIESWEDLLPGTFGVLEPVSDKNANPEDALVLVPGSAFDKKKNRIGYGGGYYDRYLEMHANYKTMGVAYSVQVIETLPKEDTDIPVQFLITEKFEL